MNSTVPIGSPARIPVLVDFFQVHAGLAHAALSREGLTATSGAPSSGAQTSSIGTANPPGPTSPSTDTTSIPGVTLATAVQAFVNGLSISSFGSDISTTRRSAVLKSFLFAQLAANGDITTDPSKNWSQQCLSYLPLCGFAPIQSGAATYSASGTTVKLDKAILDSLQNILSLSSINIVQAIITALETLPENNGALTLFDHNAIRGGQINVANISVTQPNGPSGSLTVAFTIFSLAFQGSDTRVLWVEVNNSSSVLSYSTTIFMLDDDSYTAVSAQLAAQLASHVASALLPVKLGNF